MKKKLFFLVALCAALNLFSAQLVNGIAAVVENEPITMYEVYKTSQMLKVEEKDAINFLIRDRLERAQIKLLKIDASAFEINERLEKIAAQSGVNLSNLRSSIVAQGGDYTQFKDDVARSIKQEKFYQGIFKDAKINITPNGARSYFEQNPQQFLQFSEVKVTRYVSPNRETLNVLQSSPMSVYPDVKTENLDLKHDQIPPQIRQVFQRTPNGAFTQIFQGPNGFEMFLVISKTGESMPNFEEVQDEVTAIIYKLEQDRVVSEYFNKLRTKANIKFLR